MANSRSTQALVLFSILELALLGRVVAQQEASAFGGDWGGWLKVGASSQWIQLQFEPGRVLIHDYSTGKGRVPGRALHVEEERASFIYPAPIGECRFDLRLESQGLVGEFEGPSIKGRLCLMRFHESSPTVLARQWGPYQAADGRDLWVVPRTNGGLRVISWKGEGRRFGDYSFEAWLPLAKNRYIEAIFEERDDHQPRILEFAGEGLKISGTDGLRAKRREKGAVRRARFQSGRVELEGWMIDPGGNSPRAAVAFAHGSGYVAADSLFDLYHAVRMARDAGLVVLRWDKRGVGRSTGDQGTADYHDLADDVLAAADWLRGQEGIDPRRIGIGGISQSPSVPLPIAASRSDQIAFVIAVSGFVGTIFETNLFNWGNRLRKKGRSDEEVLAAQTFMRRLLPYTLNPSPAGQRAYDAIKDGQRGESWFSDLESLAGIDTPLDDRHLRRWRNIWNVDSRDYWREVSCPVFQVWGADDVLVDAEKSAVAMQTMIAATKQKNFHSKIYPSPGDHGVGSARTPTYFDDLAAWLSREVPVR